MSGSQVTPLVIALIVVVAITAGGAILALVLSHGNAEGRSARTLRRVYGITLLIPIVWLLIFEVLVVRARWELGFWPYPNGYDPTQPFPGIVISPLDPKGFGVHYALAHWLATFAVLCTFFDVGLFLGSIRAPAAHSIRSTLLAHVAAYAVLWFVWLGDPWGQMSWFVD